MRPQKKAPVIETLSYSDVAVSDQQGTARHQLARLSLSILVMLSFTTCGATSALAAPNSSGANEEVISVDGHVDLEEYKKDTRISVDERQARLFQIGNRIVRTSVSAPAIADPVVVSENQFYLLGKKPGRATLGLWDDAGGVVCLNVRVARQHGLLKATVLKLRDAFCERLFRIGRNATIVPAVSSSGIIRGEFNHSGELEGYPLSAATSETSHHHSAAIKTEDVVERADLLHVPLMHKTEESSNSVVPITVVSGSRKVHELQGRFRRINLSQHESRIFKTKTHIAKTVVGDPKLSEPIVVSSNEFVLVGKQPGRTTVMIHDSAGNQEAFDVRVGKESRTLDRKVKDLYAVTSNKICGVRATASIPHAVTTQLNLQEEQISRVLELNLLQQRFFKTKDALTRVVVADLSIAEPHLVSPNEIALVGRSSGTTTLFLWNDHGDREGIEVRVTADEKPSSNSAPNQTSKTSWISSKNLNVQAQNEKLSLQRFEFPVHEIECWTGCKKEVISALSREDSTTVGFGPILWDSKFQGD